jgi:hypothetical protein
MILRLGARWISAQLYAPSPLPSGNHRTEGWVGPRAAMDAYMRTEHLSVTEIETRSLGRLTYSQPTHYTNSASKIQCVQKVAVRL